MSDDANIEKYCYQNATSNCTTYGGLYQWDEAMQYSITEGARGICPSGWHIPTDAEWKTLEGTVDSTYGVGDSEWDGTGWRGDDAGSHLSNDTLNGDNSSGFTVLLSGYRCTDGPFYLLGDGTYLWLSFQSGSDAWGRYLDPSGATVNRYPYDQAYGFSVRCLKDRDTNAWQMVTITTDTAVSASDLSIGERAGYYYKGLIDEVLIYNRALTAAEIERLYLADKPRHGGL
jgi:uncharacterized protein (TIGR02145 family)